MKMTLALLFTLAFFACGSIETNQFPSQPADLPSETVSPQPNRAQPYLFTEVGSFIHGNMPIAIHSLSSGGWLVATRDGHLITFNSDFITKGHSFIPTNTYWDSGLVSIVVHQEYIYAYLTLPEDECLTSEAYCNGILRFNFDENSTDPLSNPLNLFQVEMLDRDGQHQGGGMVLLDDGYLYVAIGDGGYIEGENLSSQDPLTFRGKLVRVDPTQIEPPAIVASGLRNPFTAITFSEGVLIADVGAETFEEINFFSNEASGTVNFGWPYHEGPTDDSQFVSPILSAKHCDETEQDEDPAGAPGKLLNVKNHAGVIHDCSGTVLTVAGTQGNSVIYSEIYYGWVRAFEFQNGSVINNRHIAHFPGIVSCDEGLDDSVYCVSIFASNYILKMIPNPETDQ